MMKLHVLFQLQTKAMLIVLAHQLIIERVLLLVGDEVFCLLWIRGQTLANTGHSQEDYLKTKDQSDYNLGRTNSMIN